MRKRYARLMVICILEFLFILLLIAYIVVPKIINRDKPEEINSITETIEPIVDQKPQSIAEKYPYADPSRAIFAKGMERFTVNGTMGKHGSKVDYVGEVEFVADENGKIISWNIDYEPYMPGEPAIWDAFKELSENGYNKAVIYGEIIEDGFKKKLMPCYVIIYDE